MANIKANIKNIRKTAKRHARNKSALSAMRSQNKVVRESQTPASLSNAYKKIDSFAAKGRIHKNKANRIKSRLAKAVNNKKPVPEPKNETTK
ncbi:MAG: 30S ribosomal protein S20 [Mycoplasmataceae bacterium]|jgi:small subunit ribosomal protein S20|nr:30S ribosomal protein S20 [Mycoplasmataceae bacterium]